MKTTDIVLDFFFFLQYLSASSHCLWVFSCGLVLGALQIMSLYMKLYHLNNMLNDHLHMHVFKLPSRGFEGKDFFLNPTIIAIPKTYPSLPLPLASPQPLSPCLNCKSKRKLANAIKCHPIVLCYGDRHIISPWLAIASNMVTVNWSGPIITGLSDVHVRWLTADKAEARIVQS